MKDCESRLERRRGLLSASIYKRVVILFLDDWQGV